MLTDFGSKDHYAGSMKGVVYGINPGAVIADITHDVPRHDVRRAAFMIKSFYKFFPPGTVHVAVIDPGVGSGRLPVAVSADERYFVGPDNGVFSLIYENTHNLKVVRIENTACIRDEVSDTFHGRDIFAPAAAHLSLGTNIEDLGPPVSSPVRLSLPAPVFTNKDVSGEIIYTDSFGNMVTNIPGKSVPSNSRVQVGGRRINGISGSYSEAPGGRLIALTGSTGLIEIAVSEGSAYELLGKSASGVKVIFD